MAFAPTAGAKGVDPLDPAPIDHAMNALARAAMTTVTTPDPTTIDSLGV
jgi:hypothetical protein